MTAFLESLGWTFSMKDREADERSRPPLILTKRQYQLVAKEMGVSDLGPDFVISDIIPNLLRDSW